MITIKDSKDLKELRIILKESDKRVGAFFERLMEKVAELYMEQVVRRIPKDAEYKEYRESFVAHVSSEMNRLEQDSVDKTEKTSKQELYLSGVEAVGQIKGFNQMWLERTRIKVKKQRNIDLPFKDMMLFRYQPWTLDTIPFLPASADIYFVYEDIGLQEFYKIRKGARKRQKDVRARAVQNGMYYDSDEKIRAELKAISNIFDIAMRIELGIMTQKRGHWIPAMDYVTKIGMKTILKNDRELRKILFKVGYKGFKIRKPRLPDIPANRVESFKDFVEGIL